MRSARPVMTGVGGTWGVPSARRRIDSTTATFTKQVVISSANGTSDSALITRINSRGREPRPSSAAGAAACAARPAVSTTYSARRGSSGQRASTLMGPFGRPRPRRLSSFNATYASRHTTPRDTSDTAKDPPRPGNEPELSIHVLLDGVIRHQDVKCQKDPGGSFLHGPQGQRLGLGLRGHPQSSS